MPRIDVPFIVEKQHITQPTREQLVAGGQNYFYATFKTCDAWGDISNVKAVFVRDDVSKLMPLVAGDNDCLECEIPWEVMAGKGSFRVGIFGGDRLLTNYAYVIVKHGCVVDGEHPVPPTEDWFGMVETTVGELDERVGGNAQNIEEHDEQITQLREDVDGITGDVETALDNIIAIQNSLIGGEPV